MAPGESNNDFYAVLEIPSTATLEKVTQSWRRLARERHPDKNPDDPKATASFQLLQNAYETISDLERRRAYDLRWTSKNIAAEKARAEVEERVRIAKAQEEARRRAEKEARDKAARYEKECAERKAKAAREAWEAQEARDAAEAIRSWHVLKAYREQLQREKEDRERREKDTTKCHTGIPRPNAGTAGSACQHKSFWAKLEGSRICSHCQMFQRRFAFKCPDCSKVACASCRQVLRDEKGRRGTHGPQRGYVHDSNE